MREPVSTESVSVWTRRDFPAEESWSFEISGRWSITHTVVTTHGWPAISQRLQNGGPKSSPAVLVSCGCVSFPSASWMRVRSSAPISGWVDYWASRSDKTATATA